MEDRRALRTKRELKKALLMLIQKKDINKITVSELSDMADLGRGTFYLHYKDAYDLLEQIENEVINDMDKLIEILYHENTETTLLVCLNKTSEYVYQNKELFKTLLSSKGSDQFLKKLIKFNKDRALSITKQNTNDLYSENHYYYLVFVISGAMGVLQEWVKSDMKLSTEQIAYIMQNVIEGNLWN